MIRRIAAIAAATAVFLATPSAAAPASAQPASFAAQLEQVRTTLQVDANGLHGPGAAVLAQAIAPARYVLIGEDHLSREIPMFTAGVCGIMARGGLDALAVEIGPEAARIVDANLRRADRTTRIGAFMQAHPDALAFQNGRDESDMAAGCARTAGSQFHVWGLDQEFLGASGFLLEEMLTARPGPAAAAAIRRLAVIDRRATAAALLSGSPGDLFLFAVTGAQMAEAETAVRRDGGARVAALFAALSETRAIYQSSATDGPTSNARRARLMKRNLVRYLESKPRGARVLFKFGDVHMSMGVNALGQRDLGNFVAERAEGEGTSSLHIAVYGARGVHALYNGVGRQARREPFVLSDDPDYAWIRDAVAVRDNPGDGRGWIVIDLRPLRARPPADMPRQWRDEVQRFDLLVIAPELTPSSLLGARP